MCVDVFSYCTNIYVEHVATQEMSRERKVLLLAGIPFFSVCLLLSVTAYVTWDAINVITAGDDDDSVNIFIMYGFAAGNLVIDVISGWMFYVNKDEALYTDRMNAPSVQGGSSTHTPSLLDEENSGSGSGIVRNPLGTTGASNTSNTSTNKSVDEGTVVDEWDSPENSNNERVNRHSLIYDTVNNVNMMSALSHVSADTLRTFAVFFSALVVTLFGVNSALSDAWASLFCNCTIFMTLIPLFGEIRKVLREYQVATKIALEKGEVVKNLNLNDDPQSSRNSGNSTL